MFRNSNVYEYTNTQSIDDEQRCIYQLCQGL